MTPALLGKIELILSRTKLTHFALLLVVIASFLFFSDLLLKVAFGQSVNPDPSGKLIYRNSQHGFEFAVPSDRYFVYEGPQHPDRGFWIFYVHKKPNARYAQIWIQEHELADAFAEQTKIWIEQREKTDVFDDNGTNVSDQCEVKVEKPITCRQLNPTAPGRCSGYHCTPKTFSECSNNEKKVTRSKSRQSGDYYAFNLGGTVKQRSLYLIPDSQMYSSISSYVLPRKHLVETILESFQCLTGSIDGAK